MSNKKKSKVIKLKRNFNYGGYDRSIWFDRKADFEYYVSADEHIDALPCDTEPKDD